MTTLPGSGLSPRETAARWFALQEGGRLTEDDQARLRDWLLEPRHAEAFAEAKRAWAVFDEAPEDPHLQALRRAALAVEPERRRGFRAVAASLVALVTLGVLASVWQFSRSGTGDQAAAVLAAAEGTQTYSTGAHERLDVRLDDGTQVTLNTATTMDVAFTDGQRLITLKAGQAFFDVAHDALHPFVVQTPHRRVTALGTQFEVESASGLFQVTLVEGSVRVDNEREVLASGTHSPTDVVLAPGQALVARLGVDEQVIAVDVQRRLRWRQGYIEFDNEPLGEAVAELGRYFPAPVVVRDPRVAQLRLSGVFRTTANDEFLSIIEELLPVTVQQRADGSAEIAWRKSQATR